MKLRIVYFKNFFNTYRLFILVVYFKGMFNFFDYNQRLVKIRNMVLLFFMIYDLQLGRQNVSFI